MCYGRSRARIILLSLETAYFPSLILQILHPSVSWHAHSGAISKLGVRAWHFASLDPCAGAWSLSVPTLKTSSRKGTFRITILTLSYSFSAIGVRVVWERKDDFEYSNVYQSCTVCDCRKKTPVIWKRWEKRQCFKRGEPRAWLSYL